MSNTEVFTSIFSIPCSMFDILTLQVPLAKSSAMAGVGFCDNNEHNACLKYLYLLRIRYCQYKHITKYG